MDSCAVDLGAVLVNTRIHTHVGSRYRQIGGEQEQNCGHDDICQTNLRRASADK